MKFRHSVYFFIFWWWPLKSLLWNPLKKLYWRRAFVINEKLYNEILCSSQQWVFMTRYKGIWKLLTEHIFFTIFLCHWILTVFTIPHSTQYLYFKVQKFLQEKQVPICPCLVLCKSVWSMPSHVENRSSWYKVPFPRTLDYLHMESTDGMMSTHTLSV